MSGIFDKYIDMLSGPKGCNSKTNTQRYVTTIDGHEIVMPRRRSSVSSASSDGSAGMTSRNGSVSEDPAVIRETVRTVKTTPNNRVNF